MTTKMTRREAIMPGTVAVSLTPSIPVVASPTQARSPDDLHAALLARYQEWGDRVAAMYPGDVEDDATLDELRALHEPEMLRAEDDIAAMIEALPPDDPVALKVLLNIIAEWDEFSAGDFPNYLVPRVAMLWRRIDAMAPDVPSLTLRRHDTEWRRRHERDPRGLDAAVADWRAAVAEYQAETGTIAVSAV
jgi:hypothetical protein